MNRNDRRDSMPSEAEFEHIISQLQHFEVKYPDESEVARTVEAVQRHMAQSRAGKVRTVGIRIRELHSLALSEITFMNPMYWITCLALYVAGVLLILGGLNATFIITAIAPMPFLLGLMEVFKGRDSRMMELEASCKFNAVQIILVRLWIVTVYSVLVNSILSLLFTPNGGELLLKDVTLLWLTPLSLTSGLALTMAVSFRSSRVVITFLPMWLVACLAIQTLPSLKAYLEAVQPAAQLALVALGLVFTAIQTWRAAVRSNSYFERNMMNETYD
ncbi:hypothetical protein [Paenibacillus paeoniae]|uniref:Uncharacterized protein n=1 Tax=Paenibacillus paeoniae TaxID=2292705 RepID=A0A371PMQ9_9BACL|nr:hypothetical protein [Paenibacillus paeoniae]REK76949.1 hypothetical protein DX130_08035 [Paenibacillus paeoniae]